MCVCVSRLTHTLVLNHMAAKPYIVSLPPIVHKPKMCSSRHTTSPPFEMCAVANFVRRGARSYVWRVIKLPVDIWA